jgi:hypothetical protein
MSEESNYISEISPITKLTESNPNCGSFSTDGKLNRELGYRYSWRLSKELSPVIVTWNDDHFWVLGIPDRSLPKLEDYARALDAVQRDLARDLGDRMLKVTEVLTQKYEDMPPGAIADLAVTILRQSRHFGRSFTPVYEEKGVSVYRHADYWSELFFVENCLYPALVITPTSKIVYQKNIIHFHRDYCSNIELESFLMDNLKVIPTDSNSQASIVSIVGKLAEHRERLKALAKGTATLEALKSAPDDELVVAVHFTGDKKEFHYPLSALSPSVNPTTAKRLNIDYGKFLKLTKISYQNRAKLIQEYKQSATKILNKYGLNLNKVLYASIGRINNSVNSFRLFDVDLDDTPILFGDEHKGVYGKIIKGLKTGGFYRRHEDFTDRDRKIRISILKIGTREKFQFKPDLIEIHVVSSLASYGFQSEVIAKRTVEVENSSDESDRAQVEQGIFKLLEIPTDIIFAILPTSDRDNSGDDEDSFYRLISNRILKEGKAVQAIYQDTIEQITRNDASRNNALYNIIPGILAKLGNLPYILAEPLDIADYFIGLDVSKVAKKNGQGSQNVCAGVRVYDRRGEFIRCELDPSAIEGEEINKRILDKFLPIKDLQNKRVLIYRDGRFRGKETEHLLNRAQAIGSEFILVECVKSKIPRLYVSTYDPTEEKGKQYTLSQPPQGLWFQVSNRELILVTTRVSESVGVPRPIRLKIIPQDGQNIDLNQLVAATLKLTLLHHGSLKSTRLPIPTFGADRIAYRALFGSFPTILDNDRQWWL